MSELIFVSLIVAVGLVLAVFGFFYFSFTLKVKLSKRVI